MRASRARREKSSRGGRASARAARAGRTNKTDQNKITLRVSQALSPARTHTLAPPMSLRSAVNELFAIELNFPAELRLIAYTQFEKCSFRCMTFERPHSSAAAAPPNITIHDADSAAENKSHAADWRRADAKCESKQIESMIQFCEISLDLIRPQCRRAIE